MDRWTARKTTYIRFHVQSSGTRVALPSQSSMDNFPESYYHMLEDFVLTVGSCSAVERLSRFLVLFLFRIDSDHRSKSIAVSILLLESFNHSLQQCIGWPFLMCPLLFCVECV